MARYRTKDEVDLAWNGIRRRITRELDTQVADWREAALNVLLSEAWTRFAQSLESGELPKLDAGYDRFVAKALEEAVKPSVNVAPK